MGNPIPGPAFYQIGSDGGFLKAPVTFNDPYDPYSPRLLFGSGERCDVIIDFASYKGKYFLLHNNAKSPFKGLDSPVEDEAPLAEVMLFKVKDMMATDNSSLPMSLTSVKRHSESSALKVRNLTLEELLDEEGNPIAALLNGMMFHDTITEKPILNTTEIWRIINLTEDVHPIHLHLVQFNLLDRRPFDVAHYETTGVIMYTGPAMSPDPNEMGWKDTFRAHPGQVSRIIARFNRAGLYVWHCHILEHEDNEMMRPYEVVYPPKGGKKKYYVGMGDGPRDAGLDENQAEITSLQLLQISPNPFNLSTKISYSLPEATQVTLNIYNITGQKVKTLVNGVETAGIKTVTWHGTNQSGKNVASGVSFFRLVTAQGTAVMRATLLK